MKQDILADDELNAWVCFGLLFPSLLAHGVAQVASAALSLLPPSSTTQVGDNNNNIAPEEWQLHT